MTGVRPSSPVRVADRYPCLPRLLTVLLLVVPQALAGVPLAPTRSSSEPYRCCCGSDCRCTGPCCNHAPRRLAAAGHRPTVTGGIPLMADGNTCHLPTATTPPPTEARHRLGRPGACSSLLLPPEPVTGSLPAEPDAAAAMDPMAAGAGPRAPPLPSIPATP